jgi:hypothetical protein
VNAGGTPQGVGLVRCSRAAAPRFPCPIPGESSPVRTDDRIGLYHLQARAPTRPESLQQNPQQSVGGLEAQATRPVLVENGQLVTKGENLHLQGGTGPKTGGDQSEKSDQKRAHRGSHHDPTNDRNLCVFRSDGIFGKHTTARLPSTGQTATSPAESHIQHEANVGAIRVQLQGLSSAPKRGSAR